METSATHGVIGGRYRLQGPLGEGGMARVFDAFDERLERPVAVKILRPQTLAVPGMRTRFQREARIAAQLAHPNIVAVLDYGEDHSASYLVMERLPGTTLRDEIARGPLNGQRVMLVVGEILGALAAAHGFGVVHRDIKPSNILLQHDGHTKITDFGIAKSIRLGADARPMGRRHDADGRRARHARVPGPGVPIGPAGHRAVGSVLGRRGHGRGVDREASHSGGGRERPSSPAVPGRRAPRHGGRTG